ncbi:hypothetical protein [Frigoribacterium endophyticum]|jgi:hypothetical protein|uniref:hypothetical protein n=1 Tax=Frigoribacterium endophyticum TaxID=1522176 RepID=UPI001421D8FD|nr:hypothetical protein [Frigoribacterium endophyticum]NII52054.1 hypothetical protein [Frigoribacterium endophyticum]
MDARDTTKRGAPGGLPGAWFNVAVCSAVLVGAVVYTVTGPDLLSDRLIGAGVALIGVGMLVFFISVLRRELARRRDR